MWTLPSDVDATWGPTWNNGHDVVHNSLFNDSGDSGGDAGTTPTLWPVYFNQVREIRDLLWQPDQINPLINQFAEVIRPFVNAEFARWKNAPSDAGNFTGLGGAGLSGATGQSSLSNYVADMIDFAFDPNNNGGSYPGGTVGIGGRAAWLDTLQASNGEGTNVPARPTISYLGSAGFPTSDLRFGTTPFSDPQGNSTFGAIQWRVAEVNTNSSYVPGVKRLLEVVATFDSGPLAIFSSSYLVPNNVCQPGKRYRARVRHMDNTGRWSKWSLPVEFTPAQADDTIFRENLVISEIMYHPTDPTTAEQTLAATLGQTWSDKDLEYLELMNVGSTVLDLSGVRFSSGLNFSFLAGTVLGAGERLVLVANTNAFVARYGGGHPVGGQWAPNKSLGNSGDTLDLAFGATTNAFLSVTYDDVAPWPTEADGLGFSLVLIAPESRPDPNLPENWRASYLTNGTPGDDDRPTFETWAAGFGVTGTTNDPDGDGLINIVEFALGGNPLIADGAPLPRQKVETLNVNGTLEDYLTITFDRPQDPKGVEYRTNFAPDLAGSWLANGVRIRILPGASRMVTETWRASLPISAQSQQFGQVLILTGPN